MEHFTPVSAATGGVLIGLAASLLWFGAGRIAGISGILGSLLTPTSGEAAWRVMFLAGLIADYEQHASFAIDTSKVSAADVVRHLMQENDFTITALAREIGVGQSNLSEMLGGKREWSKKVIKELAQRFSLNPMLFLA